MHCLHVFALCLEELLQKSEVLQFFHGFYNQIMDSESKLRGNKTPLLEIQVLSKDGHDREASDLSIRELPNRVVGEIPKEDIIGLVGVIRFGQMNNL